MKIVPLARILFFVGLMLSSNLALAEDNLYVFVFKDGQVQQGITIEVGSEQKLTNDYGLANFSLPEDNYEISYLHNNEIFALTEVNLLAGQQSQVFLNLTRSGADIDLDLPLSAYNQDFEAEGIKKQEGPKGTLRFKVTDSGTQAPIPGVKLIFKGYAVEAVSGTDGIATVDLSAGEYDISLIHPKYIMKVVKDVSISANSATEQAADLIQSDIELEEYVVTAPAVEGSLASTFTELKESAVIADALSSEEFTKSGDSSAADALKRVTGITIVGGKYVYVRGLGERYSVTLLNDLYIPSPEPTKRVVPLDIFPSGVIQSMNIQKTWSSDLPGTFAGGDVLIESKDIPDEDNYIQLSVSGKYNDATGKKVLTNDDNTKGLPADIIDKSSDFQELQLGFPDIGVPGYTQAELDAMNAAIANYRTYNHQTTKLKPGHKIALDVGQSFKTSGGIKYGFAGTVYSATDADHTTATKYDTYYDIPNATLYSGEKSDYQVTELSEKQGVLLSAAVDNRDGHKVKFTYLTLDDKLNSTTFSEKDGGPTGPGIDDQLRTYYEYTEKTITAYQLSGSHDLEFSGLESDFWNDLEIKWAVETAQATRYEPGTVEYYYERTSNVTDYTLNKKIWYLYSDLEDNVDNLRLDFHLPYLFNEQENHTDFGVFRYNKSRTLDNRRFKAEHGLGTDVFQPIDDVFTQAVVDAGDLVLSSNYRPDDAYTATQDVSAFYINQLLSYNEHIDLVAGLRQENSVQQLVDTRTGVPYDPLETNDSLLSLGVNYSFNDDQKLRLGYSNTLSRPDFREFSPNRYKDPITEDIVFGYPELDYTTITNIDLKYEWYFSYNEVFSVALFQKDFTNPIETIVNQDNQSQFGNKIITYRNALGATAEGIEVNLRKNLDFLDDAFNNYFVSINYAIIDSAIQLDRANGDPVIQVLTTTDRPMQGQSPYVINLNFGYDNINTGRSAIFAFNEFGKRIVALGSEGAPDYYEYPFKKLDFILKWQLNDTYDEQVKKIGYTLGLKVENILDSTREFHQGDFVYESYKPGRSFDFSFSIKY